ncbi:DUF4391 domain-containing protein [Marinoscillum sp.]|uniref:DUF4391 domain-containing protein n=1 Tax=Marinoscillum sp. TaxID=2024838 RepID=UPI003BA9DD5B
MGLPGLPKRTEFGRVIPKNAFDQHTNSKQKKLFAGYIKRMTWTHKISKETTNLEGSVFPEIQVFHVELKEKVAIPKIVAIIQKAIPYPIILYISFDDQAYLTTSQKHQHPTNEDVSIVDWTFESEWFLTKECPFSLKLKSSLDEVHKQLCVDLIGDDHFKSKSMSHIIEHQENITNLTREIKKLESQIPKEKQFNKKVRLNIELAEKKELLEKLNSQLS